MIYMTLEGEGWLFFNSIRKIQDVLIFFIIIEKC